MGLAVGIDLGTTNSAIARLNEYGRPVVIPNSVGEAITPSVICFRHGEIFVGQEAKELQAAGEPEVAAFFKRQMGKADWLFAGGGKAHSATDLSAIVIAALKTQAEAALGAAITDAVIAVPAYFFNRQREATIAAGEQAGLRVLQVINEPTAAALAYGLRPPSGEQLVLVYDLGGGTFDVTLLRLGGDEQRVLTSDGDPELGGKNWDERIVQFLQTRLEEEVGADPAHDAITMNDLMVRAEEAKKRLSTALKTQVAIVYDGERRKYELTRDAFAGLTADLMERTVSLTEKVLQGQKLRPADLDAVLLVGGATRMPMVREYVERELGHKPTDGVNVDEAVALGAALHAAACEAGQPTTFALGGRPRMVDVTTHSLGMIAVNEDRSAYLNSVILPKDRSVPCSETRPFRAPVGARGRGTCEVFMTQGEAESPADVNYLGMYVLKGIPHGSGGQAILDIEYSYDASGTVKVEGRVRSTGQLLECTVEPLPSDVPARFLGKPETRSETRHVIAYLAFDLSGSMSGIPLQEAKKAAASFVAHTDLANCSLGVLAVADRVAVKLEASQDARKILKAVDALAVGEVGGGNAGQPFDEVLRLLEHADAQRFVITLADGVWSRQQHAIERARACHAVGIESIAIGFGSADQKFLRAIASSDEASFFTSLNGLVETFSSIAQVLTETSGSLAPEPKARWKGLLERIRGG